MTHTTTPTPTLASVEKIFHGFIRPPRRPASVQEQQALAGAERHVVHHDGLTLAAWRWGDREGQGAPVLLLHGWASRASHMADFVPALVEAGFSAIAVDAPAHGESQGETLDVVGYGRSVASMARHFGPLAGVIGHSLGSAAAAYAFAHGVRVQASVHLCGPASLKRALRHGGAMNGLDAAGQSRLEALMVERLGRDLDIMELDALRPGRVHPALILHDPEDREIAPSESQALADAWPGSSLSWVTGLGHRRILRDAGVVVAAASFIARADPGRTPSSCQSTEGAT